MISPTGPLAATAAVGIAFAILVPGILIILRRSDAMGLCLSVLGSGTVTALAAVVATATRTRTGPWFLTIASVVYVTGLFRMVKGRGYEHQGSNLDWYTLLGFGISALTAVAFLSRAPIHHDARSIWFLHASWFADPTMPYSALASSSAAYEFSHLDYPPLTASIGAFTWLFGDTQNDWIPQIATGVLTLACCAILTILIGRHAEHPWERILVGLLSALSILAIIGGNGLDGYVDGLAALLIAILVVMAFSEKDSQVIVIVAIAAALAKNESFAMLIFIIVPLYLLRRRSLRPFIPALVLGTAWIIAIRTTGVGLESWRPLNTLPWSLDFADRVGTILAAMALVPILGLTVVIWFGAFIVDRAMNVPKATLHTVVGTGIVAGVILTIEVGMYLATPFLDLQAHLEPSVDRLLMLPSMVLLAGGLIGVVEAWVVFRGQLPGHDQSLPIDSAQLSRSD